jgi:glutamine synthetase
MTDRLTFIATCDLVAMTRGRSIRSDAFEARRASGVGWVPADLALTSFGDIATPNPFGALGDTRLVPIEGARITLPADDHRPETELVLARIVELDGRPWACDPRQALAEAVDALAAHGLRMVASFEQEFALAGPAMAARRQPAPFSLEAHRRAEPFGSALVRILEAEGLSPETWLPEYGPGQYEVTLAPADPLVAADRAILVRALVRDLAAAHGFEPTFVPLRTPDAVGNGVHVHMSLWDDEDRPVTLDATGSLTQVAGSFAAGLLAHAPAIVGWTAPSVISSLRLVPHRWSSAAAFVGRQNREAMVRICPAPTLGDADLLAAANLEFRACDASANPWLALAVLIRAGVDGIERQLPAPPVIEGELDGIDASERDRLGIRPLPRDQEAALAAIEADPTAAAWFAPELVATHLAIRRTEASLLADASPEERCRRYADVL